ncbi:hypothetical protein Daus18300_009952 [Diaporthe australafricana]|uniref:Uncharacterized protein n=1 Tax=Diaporthe australafricana TaxID=127596 RepID=A0ABR3WC85_9PEZI
MDSENHKYVYLPNNVTVDASEEAGLGYLMQLRIRSVGNQYYIDVIREGNHKDVRVKRVAQLLQDLNRQEKALCDLSQQVFDIRTENERRYIGNDPRLEVIMKKLGCHADFVAEFAKRVILWLDHLRIAGSKLSDQTRRTLEHSMSVQRDLTKGLFWSATMASRVGKIRGPVPGSLPYHPDDAPNPELQGAWGYIDGDHVAVEERNPETGKPQPLNWRWNPDIRMPTPYNKFFRFEGPSYFSPNKPEYPYKYNEFYLPQSALEIRDYYTRKFDQVENNFKATGRLPTRSEEEEAEHQKQQKLYGDFLAMSSGENYDRFSIVYELPHNEPVKNATDPYIFTEPGTTERQVISGLGMGKFKPEDLNRAMKVSATGIKHSVPIVDHGMYMVLNRNIEDTEAP